MTRPTIDTLDSAPMSCKRVLASVNPGEHTWISKEDAVSLPDAEQQQYNLAHTIIRHLAIEAPIAHKSGHPGGPLSAFTCCYQVTKHRNPSVDQPLRMSPGHLSILGFGLQYLFGRDRGNEHLQSPQSIINSFRTPNGLPGHIEAGIGDIPFGTGPLGKGVSNALGVAFGLHLQQKDGWVDVLLADGDSQEGQVQEAFRLASSLKLDNLIVHGDFNDIQLSGLPTNVMAADFPSIAQATGWHVIEVENGNCPAQCQAALEKADSYKGKGKPIFICYYTTMGHGITLMEEGSNTGSKNFHGAPLSDEEAQQARSELQPLSDTVAAYEDYYASEKARYEQSPVCTDLSIDFSADSLPSYSRAVTLDKGAARKDFGATHLLRLMKCDDRIYILHADLAGSGGFSAVEKEFPDRCINVGVAEANMYMMAAGMRQTGLLPVTYTFSAFGTNEARANARLIDINCGHTRCGVVHDCTHAGLSVGEDGETHQERHYLNIPFDHTQIWMTADSNQAAAMAEKSLEVIAEGHESVYTFFPRDGHEQLKTPDGDILYCEGYRFDGKADIIRGKDTCEDDITILATGIPVHAAIAAADSLSDKSIRVLNVACIRPIDSAAIVKAAFETGHILVVEDHSSEGGLASQVADIIADFQLPCSLARLGVNHYFPSAPAKDLYIMAGIDSDSIADRILDELQREVTGGIDAFVTAVYELRSSAQTSRFESSLAPYLQKLSNDKEYLSTLYSYWQERTCAEDKLPDADQLAKKLLND